jgi:hypothetical protein
MVSRQFGDGRSFDTLSAAPWMDLNTARFP